MARMRMVAQTPVIFCLDHMGRSRDLTNAAVAASTKYTVQLAMPRDFVFVNRIQWGVWSILSQLGACANFHRIHREYLYDEPPATEIGRAEAAADARPAAP